MPFDPTLAAIRFGTGLSPHHAAPQNVGDVLAELTGADVMAADFPVAPFDQAAPSMLALAVARRVRDDARGTADYDAALAADQNIRQLARSQKLHHLATEIARMVDAPVGLRERLVHFWTDHFTTVSRREDNAHLVTPYIESAIRPHVTGSFADMLVAVTLHPLMLLYLDQTRSVGPNSTVGLRQGQGLNENLARELLELHTLGAGGPYTQPDVRELAELLTGLTFHVVEGFAFNPRMAEPGAETVLGETYADAASLDVIRAALRDLAVHPATAAHLARKLAVHFVSDTPPPDLVTALADSFVAGQGALAPVYETLLAHDAAWDPARAKVRTPMEYMSAGVRALGMTGAQVMALDVPLVRAVFERPLRVMGQPWQKPAGPDGWPEAASDWIIPQTMAGRISWAMQVPARLVPDLPDPRDFVTTALGPDPDPAVAFAASASESRPDGIGVILASAAFQRR